MRSLNLIICLCFFSLCSVDEKVLVTPPITTTGANCNEMNRLPADSSIKLLFVGNSLTYTNDLPKLVKQIGQNNGISISTVTVALPNYALEDHWIDGCIQKLIVNNKFDFVIVQQGPSSQEDGRIMLLDYGARIKELCDATHSKLAFFMVWPAKINYSNFDGVIRNYTEAALSTKSILCPVGKVWKEHFDQTNDFSYYGPDQFHPSLNGSEVAAQIIFESLIKP